MKALLALEDGRTFPCKSFTGPGESQGEVVFNTSMTGYQEILTDPSYRGQMVTMTYPLIGNYGVNPADVESKAIQTAALLVRAYQAHHANWRATQSLADYLTSQQVMGVEGLDTRALTRHIRKVGALRAVVSTFDTDPISLVKKAQQTPSMVGLDLASRVSTPVAYRWENGAPLYLSGEHHLSTSSAWGQDSDRKRVVAFDFGIKYNIIRSLVRRGFNTLVVPAATSADTVKALSPNGIFLSNGPGDPEPVTYAVQTIRRLLDYRPMFGICLGHQLMALALGGSTYKLKFGHRGGNQPVKHLQTGKIEITAQNHGFAVDIESLTDRDVELTHINLNDNTLEGLRHKKIPAFCVQYHPEASPGPHDADYLFDEFSRLMHRS